MRYALLYNPIAGRGRAVAAAEEAAGLLRRAGAEVLEGRSERAGHIEEMSRGMAAEVDRVLALGGDGSLREAAAGLRAAGRAGEVALGVLPLGTGNVVARELGIPLEPVAAAEALARAEVVPMDLGLARTAGGEEHLFLAMGGFGFDAGIAERVSRARAGGLGGAWYRRSADTLYGAATLAEMVRPRGARFRVEADGEVLAERACALVAANVRTYAKGMAMVPGARPDDGLLGWHLRRSRTPWATAAALLAAQLRRAAPRWSARLGAARALTVEGSEPLCWQLDGDPMEPARRVELSLEPGALRVLRRA